MIALNRGGRKSKAEREGDSRFDKILNEELQNFSDYVTKGLKVAEGIFKVLRQHPDLSVARCKIGGSVGKRTTPGAAYKPDFDVYAFLNLKDTTSSGIKKAIPLLLQTIERALKLKGYDNAKQVNEFAVQVQVVEGGTPINVDVVAAVNFGLGDAQWYEVIRRCVSANENVTYLNSSKTEKTIEYLDKQEEFTRKVAKLAKIWNEEKVDTEGAYIYGRSTIVELVAVKAAQDEIEKMGERKTMTSALVRFFNYMETHWMSLRIVFQNRDLPKVVQNKYLSRMRESGVLIDPVNPFINYLDDYSVKNGWRYFQEAANSSLTSWDHLEKGCGSGNADNMIRKKVKKVRKVKHIKKVK